MVEPDAAAAVVEPDSPRLDDSPSSPAYSKSSFSSAPSILGVSLDKGGYGDLIGPRFRLGKILASYNFNVMMGLVVLAHTVIIVIETDRHAECAGDRDYSECHSQILLIINTMFLALYTMELLTRFYVLRLRTLCSILNCLDLFIVVAG